MRTREEIQKEALRLEERARALARDTSRVGESGAAIAEAEARTVFVFPESTVTLGAGGPSDFTHRMFRRIDIVLNASGPAYRLIEEEFVLNSQGRAVRHYDALDLYTFDNAFDAVSAGFKRIDEDRLRHGVEPIVHQIMTQGFTLAEWDRALLKVQNLTHSLDLSTAARLYMKSDAIDLLEGRLEIGDFVARTVARQSCYEPAPRVVESAQIAESYEL